MSLLYHFTSEAHLPGILESRAILPTESNIGSPNPDWQPYGQNVGPRVVWLLDEPELSAGHGLVIDALPRGGMLDKTAVRFTVEISYRMAPRWKSWAPAHRMHREWRDLFVRIGGGEEAAEAWVVFPGAIRSTRWVAVHRRVQTADGPVWEPVDFTEGAVA